MKGKKCGLETGTRVLAVDYILAQAAVHTQVLVADCILVLVAGCILAQAVGYILVPGVGCILVPGVAFTKVLVVDYIPVPEVGSIKGLEAGFTLGQTAPHICLTGHRVNNSYNIYEIMDI